MNSLHLLLKQVRKTTWSNVSEEWAAEYAAWNARMRAVPD